MSRRVNMMEFFTNLRGALRTGFAGAVLASACLLATPEAVRAQGVAETTPEALQAALASAPADVQAYYAEADGATLWISRPDFAEALVAALESAGDHALPVSRYGANAVRAALASAGGSAADAAQAEATATLAFLVYARDVGSGALEPREVSRDIVVYPERTPAPLLLSQARFADDGAAFMASLAPADPEYAALKARFAALSSEADAIWGQVIGGGPSLRPGAVSGRVAALRSRLAALGDLAARPDPLVVATADVVSDAPGAVFDPNRYDETLEAAVRRFQLRHGLNDDGVVGPMTLAALNVSPVERARQIAVNLERMRWMNRDLGHRRIIVNQPDFRVTLFEGDDVLFTERVVIGKARRHQTPEFSDQMTHLVLNPTWHVPRSIARGEILPALQADPNYLSRKNMRLIPTDGAPSLDPALVDWSQYSSGNFPFRVKQNPGAGNALGRVKFMFPNDFSIYLHDTPSKRLFARDSRAFSHGCVRVQDPLRLARILLAPQEENVDAYVERILNARREAYVNFDQAVDVHLIYRTAWIDDAGADQFRADVYGRDAKVADSLESAGVALPRL